MRLVWNQNTVQKTFLNGFGKKGSKAKVPCKKPIIKCITRQNDSYIMVAES